MPTVPGIADGRSGKILIVEDEALIAQHIEQSLQDLGYEVCAIAATGEQAIRAAGTHRPDIALMDIMLRGDMDGIEAAEAIDERHQIPVIFLTAHADQMLLQRAKLTQPLGYITKPFTERELSAALEIGLYREAMRRKLREAETALRASEARWRTVIETAADAIVVFDAAGTVQTLNPAAERIFGHRADQVIGTGIATLIPDIRAIAGKQAGAERHEVEARRADGGTIWLDIGVAAWSGDGGRHVTATMRDITERKQMQEKLVQRNTDLGRANARLDQFAYIIGHDLRSPLRAIQNSVRWIEDDAPDTLNDRTKPHLDRITSSSQRMVSMLDDLLAYSRAGLVSSVPESVDLPQLILEMTAHLEDQPGVEVAFAGPVGQIVAARAGLDVVLRNLIENGIGHAGGDVRIRIGCDDAGPAWRFEVEDDGPGIPTDYHERVFMPFVKVDRKKGGTGMGLALVGRVVEDNGGAVAVRSDPEARRGTTMIFTWAKQAGPQSVITEEAAEKYRRS